MTCGVNTTFAACHSRDALSRGSWSYTSMIAPDRHLTPEPRPVRRDRPSRARPGTAFHKPGPRRSRKTAGLRRQRTTKSAALHRGHRSAGGAVVRAVHASRANRQRFTAQRAADAPRGRAGSYRIAAHPCPVELTIEAKEFLNRLEQAQACVVLAPCFEVGNDLVLTNDGANWCLSWYGAWERRQRQTLCWDAHADYDLLSPKEPNERPGGNLVWVATTCVATIRRDRKVSRVSVDTASASRARVASDQRPASSSSLIARIRWSTRTSAALRAVCSLLGHESLR